MQAKLEPLIEQGDLVCIAKALAGVSAQVTACLESEDETFFGSDVDVHSNVVRCDMTSGYAPLSCWNLVRCKT